MNEIFRIRNVNHNFKNTDIFSNYPCKYTNAWCKPPSFFFADKVWQMVPNNRKYSSTDELRSEITQWTPSSCQFNLCETYIKGIDFT